MTATKSTKTSKKNQTSKQLSVSALLTIKKIYEAINRNNKSFKANSKLQSEVSGGGRKPWRQKGTGNARAGSNRSPIWRGGGITFGPRSIARNNKKINKKEQLKGFSTLVEHKKAIGQLKVIEINLSKPSTREALAFLQNAAIEGKVLIYIDKSIPEIELAFANISYANVKRVDSLNIHDLIVTPNIIFTPDAWQIIASRLK